MTKTIVDDKKWKKIQKELLILNNSYITVGLQQGEKYTNGLLIAQIGHWNEFGTRNGKIPERSWMRDWFDKNKNQIKAVLKKFYLEVVDGKIKAKMALNKIGEWAQGELRKSMNELKSPPNAPATIRMKGSSNPLIDTGQMLNTIRYKVYFGKPKVREM